MKYPQTIQKLLATSVLFFSVSSVSALDSSITSRYFIAPSVSSVTDTSAELSLSPVALVTDEEKSGIYFEYIQKNLVCIAIYPTPASCLPNKTEVGKTSATISNLKPGTTYTVTYKRDNTIRCIAAPCPTNDFTSASAEFTTKLSVVMGVAPLITRNLTLKSSGREVFSLQNYLIKEGYMAGPATGYYGKLTFKAVKEFQRAHGLSSAGVVGPLTRAYFASMNSGSPVAGSAEKFEGTVTGYSTGCFSDGECSIAVDGKKVITGMGRSQQPLGEVRITPDLGGYEKTIGAHANVYARKTEAGFTLYGNHDYYIEISLPVRL